MSWQRISRAVSRKLVQRRAAVDRKVADGELASYVDEEGNRIIWGSSVNAPPNWSLELIAKVRQELADLKRELFGAEQAQKKVA
jgi:hypothetical protein